VSLDSDTRLLSICQHKLYYALTGGHLAYWDVPPRLSPDNLAAWSTEQKSVASPGFWSRGTACMHVHKIRQKTTWISIHKNNKLEMPNWCTCASCRGHVPQYPRWWRHWSYEISHDPMTDPFNRWPVMTRNSI